MPAALTGWCVAWSWRREGKQETPPRDGSTWYQMSNSKERLSTSMERTSIPFIRHFSKPSGKATSLLVLLCALLATGVLAVDLSRTTFAFMLLRTTEET